MGCANITSPTGGKRDIVPPRIVSLSPQDSQKNIRIDRIELYFNEYITLNNPVKEVQLSPILPIAPTVTGVNKHVVVKIVDSLLEPNTTYRLSFGDAIKDLHEGNVFKGYTYTFSTGAYFDSLQLWGKVTNAATGTFDLEGVKVLLYYASDNDSAIVRQKPRYVTTVEKDGQFSFKGLPPRAFRIYALKDGNENLTYDGPVAGEMAGFMDNNVLPGDTSIAAIHLRIFAEELDTTSRRHIDSAANTKEQRRMGGVQAAPTAGFVYLVNIDTSDKEKKTFDVNLPVKITFGAQPQLNTGKISLGYDSAGKQVDVNVKYEYDSIHKVLKVAPPVWKENTLYTLRLPKGFARDSAGQDLAPSKYSFRTKEEDDYGEITVRLPAKYRGNDYLFRVQMEKDSVYQKPVTDTIVKLRYLQPGKYIFRVIADKNHNGKWDAGKLLERIQPEEVIPRKEELVLKSGWRHNIDFEEKKTVKPGLGNGKLK